jgi:hypothetical protein
MLAHPCVFHSVGYPGLVRQSEGAQPLDRVQSLHCVRGHGCVQLSETDMISFERSAGSTVGLSSLSPITLMTTLKLVMTARFCYRLPNWVQF